MTLATATKSEKRNRWETSKARKMGRAMARKNKRDSRQFFGGLI